MVWSDDGIGALLRESFDRVAAELSERVREMDEFHWLRCAEPSLALPGRGVVRDLTVRLVRPAEDDAVLSHRRVVSERLRTYRQGC